MSKKSDSIVLQKIKKGVKKNPTFLNTFFTIGFRPLVWTKIIVLDMVIVNPKFFYSSFFIFLLSFIFSPIFLVHQQTPGLTVALHSRQPCGDLTLVHHIVLAKLVNQPLLFIVD